MLSLLLPLTLAAHSALAHPAASPAAAVKCPIVFDGRIPAAASPTDFDATATSPFNPDYVKGQNLKWSEILLFPTGLPTSHFDVEGEHKPVEVTLSDKSIFMTQRGFRRAGLQFKGDSNNGSKGSQGVKTLHFSIMIDKSRPFNLSHEYLNVWHETADYSANQFNFQMGQMIDQRSLPRDTFKVLNRQNRQIWSTPIDASVWNNFAITIDYTKKYVSFCIPLSRLTREEVSIRTLADMSPAPSKSTTPRVTSHSSPSPRPCRTTTRARASTRSAS